MTLDDLRARYPSLGFALYALDPRGVVTLEIYDGDDIFPFRGATAAEAIGLAFPPEPEAETARAEPEQPASVFD